MKAKRFFLGAFFVLMIHFSTPVSGQHTGGSSLFGGQTEFSHSPRYSLQAGTAFTTGLAGSGMFTHTLAPSINWDVSRRFTLELGTILSTTHMSGLHALFPFTPHMAGGESIDRFGRQGFFSGTFYAVGAYQVNPRLTLVGSSWMERSQYPTMNMNPQAFDMNMGGARFGFDYRVSDNFSFGAEVGVSSGYNPFTSYGQFGWPGAMYQRHSPMFHSPSAFHRGARW